MKFDGVEFASELEKQVKLKLATMKKKPVVVSLLVGDDSASQLYTRLKQRVAERVGIEFKVEQIAKDVGWQELRRVMLSIVKDKNIDGVMVQLPLPVELRGRTKELLKMIPIEKDMDGLRWRESGVVPATVRAIMLIVDKLDLWKERFVVVGARGMVGEPLVYYLRQRGVEVVEVEWDTVKPVEKIKQVEVVISCTGKAGLLTAEMVKAGGVVIDVGAPKGDMQREVYQQARVSVEVPGGVGPVTIVSLMLNVVEILMNN